MPDLQTQMPNVNEASSGLWSWFKRFRIEIVSVLALVVALTDAFKSVKAEPRFLTIGLLVIVIGGWLSRLFFICFKRRRVRSSFADGHFTEFAHSPRERRRALISLIAFSLFTSGVVTTWFHIHSLPSTKVRVLIAEFDGPEPKKYRVTENIIRRLREATSKYDDVEIEALGEMITEQQGSKVAREKGKDRKASIALWGWYAATGAQVQVTVHFETLKESYSLPLEIDQQTINAPIAQLETFVIQTQLSSELSYLTLAALGLIRYETNDYDAAILFFTDALAEQHLPEEMIKPAAIYSLRGSAYLYRDSCDRAIVDYDQAIRQKPDEARAYSDRGIAYACKGDYDRAIADYNQAIQLKPDDATVYFFRGLTYHEKSDYDRAIADFDLAIRLKPGDPDAYHSRGLVYANRGDYARAIADFDRAIRLEPSCISVLLSRGDAYSKEGNYDSAIDDYNKAIQLESDFPEEAYFNRGRAYSNRGSAYIGKHDYDRAIADLDEAIRLKPDNVHAYHKRGHAHYYKGDYDLAIADLSQALLLEPREAINYYIRGLANLKKDDSSAATTDFQKIFEFTKDTTLWGNAQDQLRKLGVEVPQASSALK